MDKIRIGVIGAGRWGPNLIRNFHTNPASQVIAVADHDQARLKLMRDRHPDIRVTESSDEVITNPEIDAIVICTPTATHYEITKKCLENGKHVFVEKPLAKTASECTTLIDLAKKKGKVLFVGHVFVYNAGIQAVKKFINSGDLGKLHYIHITRTNLGPVRTDVSALWDLAPHDLSILNYWLNDMPVKVSAVGGRYLNPNIEDAVFATYTFANKMLANVHVSWLNPKKVREIVIVGEKKMLMWTDMDLNSPVQIFDKKVTVDTLDNKLVESFVDFRASIHEGDTLIPKIALNEPLAAECGAFLKAMKDPSTSLSTGEHGRAVVEALVATDRSLAEHGREIAINPT